MADLPDIGILFFRLGLALLLGMLVGLERQYAAEKDDSPRPIAAGVRTFSLIALFGALSSLVSEALNSPLIFAAGLICVGLLVITSHAQAAREGEVGLTSEIASLVVFFIGGLCWWNLIVPATALAIAVTSLLSFKGELHGFAQKLSPADVLATLKFAIITGIALPFIPNQSFFPAPFDVINPFDIWLMVVFISGIDYIGYIAIKLIGSHRGAIASGFLGGLASSTATTLSFSRQSTVSPSLSTVCASAILISWSVMFVRILIEAFVVDRVLMLTLAKIIIAPLLFSIALAVFLHRRTQQSAVEQTQISNPFKLSAAFYFAGLYGLILVISRATQMYLGNEGLYLSSFASGLADVDAITLSVAQLRANNLLDLESASRAITLAMLANTLVKGGIVIAIGDAGLRKAIIPGVLGIVISSLIAISLL